MKLHTKLISIYLPTFSFYISIPSLLQSQKFSGDSHTVECTR